jgi:hypothetical protein
MAGYFPHGIAPTRRSDFGHHVEVGKGQVPTELIDLARLDSADVLRQLSTSAIGLSDGEAEARLRQAGPQCGCA